MSRMRSVVLLLVLAALACDDGSGAPSDGNLAGVSGMSAGAGAGGGAAGMAGGTSGISGSGGMVAGAGGSGGAAGMAGGTSGSVGSGGMVAGGSGGAAGTMGPACIAATGGAPQPTFTWIFENVVPGCAGPPCHSSVAGGGLVFGASKDDAYAQLMMPAMGMNNGPSTSDTNCKDSGQMRVVPNNPDASLFYNKLRTDKPPPCGNRMPPGSELCAATLEAIRMWIASGAQKN